MRNQHIETEIDASLMALIDEVSGGYKTREDDDFGIFTEDDLTDYINIY